jgi:hypothetical protein
MLHAENRAKTIAHRDHIHVGMTEPGANALTRFRTT